MGAYGARPLRPALVGETQDGSRLETHTGDGRRWGAAQGETKRQYPRTLSVLCRAARCELHEFGRAVHSLRPDGCWRRKAHTTVLHTRRTHEARYGERRCKQKKEPQWRTTMQAEEGAAVGVRKQPSSALFRIGGVENVPKDGTVFCVVRGSREGAMGVRRQSTVVVMKKTETCSVS